MSVIIGGTCYLTIGEVGSLIGQSTQTIKRWGGLDKIPASTRQKSNNWRIHSPGDVEAIKEYSNSLNKPSVQTDLLKGQQ